MPTEQRDSQHINGHPSDASHPSSGDRAAPLSNPSRHEDEPAIKIIPMQSTPLLKPRHDSEPKEKEGNKIVLQLESKTHKNYP